LWFSTANENAECRLAKAANVRKVMASVILARIRTSGVLVFPAQNGLQWLGKTTQKVLVMMHESKGW